MRAAALVAATILAGAPASAQAVLPSSGLAVERLDAAVEVQLDGAVWLILRYLAPDLAGGAVGYAATVPDLELLCRTEGRARAAELGVDVASVVVILMDRPIVRGEPAPDATQYIGAFTIDGEDCRWE
jgi:hypothetical protein